MNDAIAKDDVANLAGHFIHEWCHVSGFFHFPNNSARRDVPYNVGNIVRGILRDRFDERLDPALSAVAEEVDCGCVDEGGPVDGEADPNQMM